MNTQLFGEKKNHKRVLGQAAWTQIKQIKQDNLIFDIA
jgi:hypothetical protein